MPSPLITPLRPRKRQGSFFYSPWEHPVARVLKLECFQMLLKKIPEGGAVLDYGSGDQPYEELLLQKFNKYVSADFGVTNKAYRRRPMILLEGPRIPVDSNTLQCIVMTEVLEHVYDPKPVLKEAFRVLAPGGFFVGTVPFALPEHDQPHDFYRYTSFCLENLFTECGFEVVRIERVGDSVGVMLSALMQVLKIGSKIVAKMGFPVAAKLFGRVIKIPEVIYYYALRVRWLRNVFLRFQDFPLGFAFCFRKPT